MKLVKSLLDVILAATENPPIMSDRSDLPEALRRHRQLEPASCAVSAFECVAKLHRLIERDISPLKLTREIKSEDLVMQDFWSL